MTEPLDEFKLLDRTAYPDDSILRLGLVRLQGGAAWSPTEQETALMLTSNRGSVLIAAKGTDVEVRFQQSGKTVLVHSEDDVIDGLYLHGDICVTIDAKVQMLEAVEWPSPDRRRVPRIDITHRGVVRDFVGVANVQQLQGRLISTSEGEKPGRLVGTIAQTGGKLIGVDITGIRGDLKPLGKLSIFSPDIESLYDLGCFYDPLARWLRWFNRGFFHSDPPEDERSTPREMAHWFRDLYDALGPMTVSASTRSAVRWCYSLLEHEAIKRRWVPRSEHSIITIRALQEVIESGGRWLYRCVGYGQRPSRALWCWMLTSAAVARWSDEIRIVENGLAGWIGRFLEVALSPLGGVLQLGSWVECFSWVRETMPSRWFTPGMSRSRTSSSGCPSSSSSSRYARSSAPL